MIGPVGPEPARRPPTGSAGGAGATPVPAPEDGRYRRLTPVELERLTMFPDAPTAGVSGTWRAFFMGNALVVGVVERIGRELLPTAAAAR